MIEGKLIYREKGSRLIFVLFLIFFGLIYSAASFDSLLEWILAFLPASLFLIGAYSGIKKEASAPGFFEHGIGFFEKNQQIRFEYYAMFVRIEYAHLREGEGEDAASSYYLDFWHQDGSSVRISKGSIKGLYTIWQQLLESNPELLNRLVCYQTDYRSKRLYDILKNEPQK